MIRIIELQVPSSGLFWSLRVQRPQTHTHAHKHTQRHAGFTRGQCLLKPLFSRWSKDGIIRTKDWLLQGIQRGADSCLSQWFLCSRLLLKLSFNRLLSAVFSSVIAGTVASFYGLSPCLPSITGVANINATGCSSSLKTRWNVSTWDLHEKDQFLFRFITVQAHWGRGGEGSVKRRAFVMAVCTHYLPFLAHRHFDSSLPSIVNPYMLTDIVARGENIRALQIVLEWSPIPCLTRVNLVMNYLPVKYVRQRGERKDKKKEGRGENAAVAMLLQGSVTLRDEGSD